MHSIPIGYEVSATPLQIAMSYAAIANGGFMLKPYVVEKLRNTMILLLRIKEIQKKSSFTIKC